MSNDIGAPVLPQKYNNCIQHLSGLVNEVIEKVNTLFASDNDKFKDCDEKLNSIEDINNIDIIGFSKGCVVLNQIIFELNNKPEIKENIDIFKKVIILTFYLSIFGGL